ncbi:hypothetical protein JOJ87_001431 [Rhodococcus ruber]|uniref:hypothetical protein n=1 Tax=Rhodococcus ruber TaxID=1830 RepID=UPI001AE76868|nr:hypothetical protein [Rhodococcus ruber]MBP2211087.1 hypothetical protein [Rhodococcus ruber]
MARPKVTFKMAGFRAVRTSPNVEAELQKQADRIAAEANASSGGGYVVKTSRGTSRSRAVVVTTDGPSMKDNAKNNTLIRNLKGGG